jgi:hypothetical protein
MDTIDTRAPAYGGRLARLVRAWWPVPVLLALGVLGQTLFMSRYDVGGHAAEHLSSAAAPFVGAAVLGILFWATPRARRQVDVLLAAALWFGATVVVTVGNVRVIDDLIDAGHSQTPTTAVPDIADHALANSSAWYASAAALVLVAAFRLRRHIGNRATIGAVVVNLIVPPWIVPGAGVVVLAIVRCVTRNRPTGASAQRADRLAACSLD